MREVEQVVADGMSEVVLLGQTVNSYHDGEQDFADLLRAVGSVPGVRRLRFTSPHPNDFSDRVVRNQTISEANAELHQWHTEAYKTRLPGLKWGRTFWVAAVAGGPYLYTGKGMRDAHYGLKISPEIFDVVRG